jgi:hypothetical protein
MRTAGHRMSCELRFCGQDGRVLNRQFLRLKPSSGAVSQGSACLTGKYRLSMSRWRPPPLVAIGLAIRLITRKQIPSLQDDEAKSASFALPPGVFLRFF